MSFFQEYSLLFAIAIPVAVVVLIEAALWMSGERGASLLPGLSRYPTVMSKVEIAAGAAPAGRPSSSGSSPLADTRRSLPGEGVGG